MTQPRKKNTKKNKETETNNDRLNSLREDFQLDQTGIEHLTTNDPGLNENEADNIDRLDLTINHTETADLNDKITNYDDKSEEVLRGTEGSLNNINLNTKVFDENLTDTQNTNFNQELSELRSMESQNSEENFGKSPEKTEISESNKSQRSVKQTNKKNVDLTVNIQKPKEENDFFLGDFEDHIKN